MILDYKRLIAWFFFFISIAKNYFPLNYLFMYFKFPKYSYHKSFWGNITGLIMVIWFIMFNVSIIFFEKLHIEVYNVTILIINKI